ncbi:MAG: App1 family protein [Chitinophagaceae bacterium]
MAANKISIWSKLKTGFFNWFRLTNEITIKVYHGYGHADQLAIYGHVFALSPLPRKRYRQSVITNTLALLRLFFVRPMPGAPLRTEWQGKKLTTQTDKDGFFKFEWKDEPPLEQGWHELTVELVYDGKAVAAQGKGNIYIPYPTQYGFISDIDDTFLISHSANLRKRLFVLFTQNARSRKPFDGSVKHYQLLAKGNTTDDAPNPFFYVSSSEWNLYDYILEFTRINELPRGVFLLSQLKRINQLLKTGQNNHHTKFARIVRIMEGYPKQRFVLLGDSSQQDPYIYEAIVKHFPKQIQAVYIRDVYEKNKQKVSDVLHKIEGSGVPCCFFRHSSEAVLHSRKIGLITTAEAAESLESEQVER